MGSIARHTEDALQLYIVMIYKDSVFVNKTRRSDNKQDSLKQLKIYDLGIPQPDRTHNPKPYYIDLTMLT